MGMKRLISLTMLVAFFILSLSGAASIQAKAVTVVPITSPMDYSKADNWLYDGAYPENEVDVFIVAPSVDTIGETNSEYTAQYKARFRNAMNQQQAIYAKTCRIYAPYYRQAALKAYSLDAGACEQALSNAYVDISAAFKYYLEHKNNGRPIILAGFSQGADMCYRILEEYYGGDGERAVALRDNLIAVYAIGWPMTEEMIAKHPQIVPAKGEDDTGVVISYECEDGTVNSSLTIPAGVKALSINPLNWRTDSTKADKSLNKGSVTQDSKTGAITSVTVGKYGAYIDPNKGTLVVTNIDTKEFPPVLTDLFPEGSFHLYDNFLFFVNLQDNVEKRTKAFLAKRVKDAA